jgi:MFS family permease
MNVWCFACSLFGTRLLSSWGRKPTALLSQGLLIALLFIIGGLTKNVQDYKGSVEPHALTYGAVAAMFLFQGFYSIAWTPLLYVYPPEVMNYAIRANGLALSILTLNLLAYGFLGGLLSYFCMLTEKIESSWFSLCQLLLEI